MLPPRSIHQIECVLAVIALKRHIIQLVIIQTPFWNNTIRTLNIGDSISVSLKIAWL